MCKQVFVMLLMQIEVYYLMISSSVPSVHIYNSDLNNVPYCNVLTFEFTVMQLFIQQMLVFSWLINSVRQLCQQNKIVIFLTINSNRSNMHGHYQCQEILA